MMIGNTLCKHLKKVVKPLVSTPYRHLWREKVDMLQRFPGDAWFLLRYKRLRKRLIIVVGSSHRVGSTWLYWMLRDVAHCQPAINTAPTQFRHFGTLKLTPQTYDYLHHLKGHKIFKSHSFPPISTQLAQCAHFISIYRDPRDVLISSSFYMAHLDVEKGGHGNKFRQLSIPERVIFLLKEQETNLLTELENWFKTPFAYQIQYESLQKNPLTVLETLTHYLDIPASTNNLHKIVRLHSFEKKSGRQPGQLEITSPMRKGIVGDWRNYFDEDCINLFKTEKAGRWNQLLLEMGYEQTLDW